MATRQKAMKKAFGKRFIREKRGKKNGGGGGGAVGLVAFFFPFVFLGLGWRERKLTFGNFWVKAPFISLRALIFVLQLNSRLTLTSLFPIPIPIPIQIITPPFSTLSFSSVPRSDHLVDQIPKALGAGTTTMGGSTLGRLEVWQQGDQSQEWTLTRA